MSGVAAFGANEWALPPASQRAKDLAHSFDARLAPTRDALPPGVGAVSYWSDDADGGVRQIVHYAMAPVLVDEAVPPSREFLLVDRHKGGAAQPPTEGYSVFRELAPGLTLLRRTAAP